TWAPSGYILDLVPGKDVVWINAPGDRGRVEGVAGAATDPITMGLAVNDLTVAANNQFLNANPAAKVLMNRVRLPLKWLSDMGRRINKEGMGNDAIKQAAQKWIENHHDKTDEWLNAAIAAGCDSSR